jgi:hypothetical protein
MSQIKSTRDKRGLEDYDKNVIVALLVHLKKYEDETDLDDFSLFMF